MAWVTHQQLANMCSLAGPADWSALPWGNGKGMKGMGWDQAKGKAQGKGEEGKKGKSRRQGIMPFISSAVQGPANSCNGTALHTRP